MRKIGRNFYRAVFSCLILLVGTGLSVTVIADGDNPVRKKADNRSGKRNRQQFHKQIFNKLSKEQREKLIKLQKENPEAFRKEIKDLVKKHKQKRAKGNQQKETNALLKQYNNAEGADKAAVLVKIREKITRQFYSKMTSNKRNIERTEKRLTELKAQLQKREDNAEKIIEERIKDLTRDPHLKW